MYCLFYYYIFFDIQKKHDWNLYDMVIAHNDKEKRQNLAQRLVWELNLDRKPGKITSKILWNPEG